MKLSHSQDRAFLSGRRQHPAQRIARLGVIYARLDFRTQGGELSLMGLLGEDLAAQRSAGIVVEPAFNRLADPSFKVFGERDARVGLDPYKKEYGSISIVTRTAEGVLKRPRQARI